MKKSKSVQIGTKAKAKAQGPKPSTKKPGPEAKAVEKAPPRGKRKPTEESPLPPPPASPSAPEASAPALEPSMVEPATEAPASNAGTELAEQGKEPAAREVDSRLPAPGSVLQKRDRQGLLRCECVVEADGVRYRGTLYRSLSAAALAAAKDLGLRAASANGFAFWGLTKAKRGQGGKDPLAGLSKSWDNYNAKLEQALTAQGEGRLAVLAALERHARVLQNLFDEGRERSAEQPTSAAG